jgi:hypothetical protein
MIRRCPVCGQFVSARANKRGELIMAKHGFIVQYREDGRDPKKFSEIDDDYEHGFKKHSYHCEGTGQRALTASEEAQWYVRFIQEQQAILASMDSENHERWSIQRRMQEMPKPRRIY